MNEHNQHFDDQIFNMRIKFSNLINEKTPFLKLEKDLKQVARLSLEDDFSLMKNFQAFNLFLNRWKDIFYSEEGFWNELYY